MGGALGDSGTNAGDVRDLPQGDAQRLGLDARSHCHEVPGARFGAAAFDRELLEPTLTGSACLGSGRKDK